MVAQNTEFKIDAQNQACIIIMRHSSRFCASSLKLWRLMAGIVVGVCVCICVCRACGGGGGGDGSVRTCARSGWRRAPGVERPASCSWSKRRARDAEPAARASAADRCPHTTHTIYAALVLTDRPRLRHLILNTN